MGAMDLADVAARVQAARHEDLVNMIAGLDADGHAKLAAALGAELTTGGTNTRRRGAASMLPDVTEDERAYLESVGALRLFGDMSQALLSGRPADARAAVATMRPFLERVAEGSPASPPASPLVPGMEESFWKRIHKEGEFSAGSTLRLLRQDAITGRWAGFITNKTSTTHAKPQQYATAARADRAHQQPERDDRCPFCPGREEATEVARVWPDGTLTQREGLPEAPEDKQRWLVRVLRNPFPYLATPQGLYDRPFPGDPATFAACHGILDNSVSDPQADHPCYRMVDGIGASEVVVESPVHRALIALSTDAQVAHGLRALVARGRALRRHACAHQLVYFKQYGKAAGGSLVHPHLQICTLPVVTEYMQQLLQNYRAFRRAHGCGAAQKLLIDDVTGADALATSRLVRATAHFVASVPYARCSRIVVAPRRACTRFEDITEPELVDLAALLRLLLAALYRYKDDPAYNVWWETAPTEHAGQAVPADVFRWTLHIKVAIGSVTGFGLASGVELAGTLPEDTAHAMRAAIEEELAEPLTEELGLA